MDINKLEHIINIAEGIEELDNNSKDLVVLLRTLIAEENTAAASYTDKAKKVEELGYSDIAKILLDIADEELVHAGELQGLLIKEGLSSEEQAAEGIEEVNNKLNSEKE